MAQRFVWVGAFLPHQFLDKETIQMYWKEVPQLGGAHQGQRLPSALHARFFFLSCRSSHVGQTRGQGPPLSLGLLITTPNAWAKSGTRLRAALELTTLARPAINAGLHPGSWAVRHRRRLLAAEFRRLHQSDCRFGSSRPQPLMRTFPLLGFALWIAACRSALTTPSRPTATTAFWADAWQTGPSCLAS